MRKHISTALLTTLSALLLASCASMQEPVVTETWVATVTPNPTVTSIPPTQTQTNTPTLTVTKIPRNTQPEPTITPTLVPLSNGRLAFASRDGIIIVNTDGSGLVHVSVEGYADSDLVYNRPTWSPDGHWIAFLVYNIQPGKGFRLDDIYVAKTDGTKVKRITFNPNDLKGGPTWSPTGDSLLFPVKDANGYDFYQLNPKDGGNYYNLTKSSGYVYDPSWSPDGKMIAFWVREEINGKYTSYPYIMDEDGKNRKRVIDFNIGRGKITWSPDGKQIAFRSTNGCGDFYAVNIDGSNLSLLKVAPLWMKDPSWSPDGKHIAFTGTKSSCDKAEALYLNWRIYLSNADGSGLMKFPFQPDDDNYEPAWAPVPLFQPENEYSITEVGANLNVRNEPTTKSLVLTKLQTGDLITILEGPVDAEDYYWWKIQTEDRIVGWVVEISAWYKLIQEE